MIWLVGLVENEAGLLRHFVCGIGKHQPWMIWKTNLHVWMGICAQRRSKIGHGKLRHCIHGSTTSQIEYHEKLPKHSNNIFAIHFAMITPIIEMAKLVREESRVLAPGSWLPPQLLAHSSEVTTSS